MFTPKAVLPDKVAAHARPSGRDSINHSNTTQYTSPPYIAPPPRNSPYQHLSDAASPREEQTFDFATGTIDRGAWLKDDLVRKCVDPTQGFKIHFSPGRKGHIPPPS